MTTRLARTPRQHLAGRPTHTCQRDGVLLTHDDHGHVTLAETLTLEARGRCWMLTRHAAYSRPVYWLATPLSADGRPEPPTLYGVQTQLMATTLAALLKTLEWEAHIAPLRGVGSTTPTRQVARPAKAPP